MCRLGALALSLGTALSGNVLELGLLLRAAFLEKFLLVASSELTTGTLV